ncbi:Spermidine/putrescine import ATP-binding protein PotA [Bosea sp. LC85]|uniref:ABC transporter ATP-binding protein n=1 Tax=Bosea sp. LC85 TaxID=1502851 RepID=UPI0004E38586|nr:ABC transporter ATP-binding protein [Bosea sp. LC85]KFC65808.1 Spermidine/putrescine import ATP-binding protein PotA [Bosea sp. LC85]
MSIHAANFHELRLERLGRQFGTHNALDDVSLTIRKGEFIALLGPSGCGKSTTLNCIAGLLVSTSGGIWLDDKRIDRLRPEERGFGMVFQNYALFPHMSVRKNIAFGLQMRRVPSAEIARRVEEAVALVRLNGQEDKLPGQLSGGQQQRVAIARAIVIEPPLVLMDEPLSNLDAKLRLEMRAEMRRIHNSLGATTIYVTHDQEEALSLADRIVVLRDGTIRQVGTPHELFAEPDHLDVADFMGFRNRVEGTLVSTEGGIAEIAVGEARLHGRLREQIRPGARAVVAIRPDDLIAVPAGADTLAASVISSEFRGRDHVGFAQGPGGRDLVFAAPRALAVGETVHLQAEPDRAVVFAGADA